MDGPDKASVAIAYSNHVILVNVSFHIHDGSLQRFLGIVEPLVDLPSRWLYWV